MAKLRGPMLRSVGLGRMGVGILAIACVGATPPPAAEAGNPPGYVVTLGLDENPVYPAIAWKPLDESKLLELCQDADGCKLLLAIGGTFGNGVQTEMFQIAADGLGWTSTTEEDPSPPPKVDADHHNRLAISVEHEVAAGQLGVCLVSDQEVVNQVDVAKGFLIELDVTAASAGVTACAFRIYD